MTKLPIRRKIINKNLSEFFEGKVLIARARRRGKRWVVRPEVDGYPAEKCNSIEEAAYVVHTLADRRTMIQLRYNIEHWLEKRGLAHSDIYLTLKIQKNQYFSFFDEEAARGPTLKTLRNIASVLRCTVANLVSDV
jgi:hypothetical protein